MKSSLEVKPLKKYRIPIYPSYSDEDALNSTKEKISKYKYYSAALFSVVSLFSYGQSNSQNQTLENPIKFKDLGFPHRTARFGTGLPSRLNEETAVSIIDSVFIKNGIILEKNIQISEGNVNFKTTAYNKKHNIGYVWLNSKKVSKDCFNSWRGRGISQKYLLPEDVEEYDKISEIKKSNNYDEYRMKMDSFEKKLLEKNYYKLLSIKNSFNTKKETKKEIAQYLESYEGNKEDENYGQKLIDKYHNEVIDLEEMKEIVNAENYSIATFSVYNNATSSYQNWGYEKDENGKYIPKKNAGYKKAIENLANLVQDYIDWAKSEGRF